MSNRQLNQSLTHTEVQIIGSSVSETETNETTSISDNSSINDVDVDVGQEGNIQVFKPNKLVYSRILYLVNKRFNLPFIGKASDVIQVSGHTFIRYSDYELSQLTAKYDLYKSIKNSVFRRRKDQADRYSTRFSSEAVNLTSSGFHVGDWIYEIPEIRYSTHRGKLQIKYFAENIHYVGILNTKLIPRNPMSSPVETHVSLEPSAVEDSTCFCFYDSSTSQVYSYDPESRLFFLSALKYELNEESAFSIMKVRDVRVTCHIVTKFPTAIFSNSKGNKMGYLNVCDLTNKLKPIPGSSIGYKSCEMEILLLIHDKGTDFGCVHSFIDPIECNELMRTYPNNSLLYKNLPHDNNGIGLKAQRHTKDNNPNCILTPITAYHKDRTIKISELNLPKSLLDSNKRVDPTQVGIDYNDIKIASNLLLNDVSPIFQHDISAFTFEHFVDLRPNKDELLKIVRSIKIMFDIIDNSKVTEIPEGEVDFVEHIVRYFHNFRFGNSNRMYTSYSLNCKVIEQVRTLDTMGRAANLILEMDMNDIFPTVKHLLVTYTLFISIYHINDNRVNFAIKPQKSFKLTFSPIICGSDIFTIMPIPVTALRGVATHVSRRGLYSSYLNDSKAYSLHQDNKVLSLISRLKQPNGDGLFYKIGPQFVASLNSYNYVMDQLKTIKNKKGGLIIISQFTNPILYMVTKIGMSQRFRTIVGELKSRYSSYFGLRGHKALLVDRLVFDGQLSPEYNEFDES